jgi:hypothetical protein
MGTKQFRASATGHQAATKETPRAAAATFFEQNPKARKCSVIEGAVEVMGGIEYFTVRYGRASEGHWPQSFKDITRKTVGTLPAAINATLE